MVTILSILIYAVFDVHQRCNSSSNLRSNRLLTDGGNGNVFFLGGGTTREAVFKFRDLLEPQRVGRDLVSARSEYDQKIIRKEPIPGSRTKDRPSIFGVLKSGHEPDLEESGSAPKGEGKKRSSSEDKDSQLFRCMGRDPVMFMSAATSRFAREYSPFRAKAFMSKKQLLNLLVCPAPLESGTAFVLPTGHVINKAYGMSHADLDTWNKPESDIFSLTPSCARTDPIHRINLFGFAGSKGNAHAKDLTSVESLVCNCEIHRGLLQEPDPKTYSPDPKSILVDVANKQVLLPGPGSKPLRCKQVTVVPTSKDGSTGGEEEDMQTYITSDENREAVAFKPVYGSSLVTLPSLGAPLALNCPCTDREDGVYPVVSTYEEGQLSRENAFLRRDLVGFLNANPIETSRLTSGGGDVASSWLATGKALTTVSCQSEKIVKIK
nr:MAG: wsv325-like protein [Metapenaeus ensis nimavirus]